MTQVGLKYGGGYQVFDAYRVIGFAKFEAVRFTTTSKQDLTGAVDTRVAGFQRLITLDLGVISTAADQEFLSNWLHASDKEVWHIAETLPVVLLDPSGYENEWLEGSELDPAFVIELIERDVRTTIPDTWTYEGELWTRMDQTTIHPALPGDYNYSRTFGIEEVP
jgi:hypothetical protein